jgi:hypothetical protein
MAAVGVVVTTSKAPSPERPRETGEPVVGMVLPPDDEGVLAAAVFCSSPATLRRKRMELS